MARIEWNGPSIRRKAAAAAALAVDRTITECVRDAARGHPQYPPASKPGGRYANRTGHATDMIRVSEEADAAGMAAFGARMEGDRVVGRWGGYARYALFLEIGTSVAGPTATEREDAADGNMDEIAPPIGPRMAARPTLRPAADRQYPLLVSRMGQAFRGEAMT